MTDERLAEAREFFETKYGERHSSKIYAREMLAEVDRLRKEAEVWEFTARQVAKDATATQPPTRFGPQTGNERINLMQQQIDEAERMQKLRRGEVRLYPEPAKAEPAQMSEERVRELARHAAADAVGNLSLGISAGVLRLDRDDSGNSDAISVVTCADIVRNAIEGER